MSTMWLSKASLNHDQKAVAALASVLVPEDGSARVAATHHLVWSLFAGDADRKRDFLWREERPGHFLILSPDRPGDGGGLCTVESKEFAPALSAGDRLGFSLRANAVVSRGEPGSGRGKRHDVVMDVLRHHPKGERASHRLGLVTEAGAAWLARQGERHGFALEGQLACDGYEAIRVLRGRGEKPLTFSQIDFAGVLSVTDPARFIAAIGHGFGRARAFGCGLMLIRRV